MSLLTKEQAAHVAYMRDLYCVPSGYDEIDELISIIDDLQARAPKQYTEGELRQEFEKTQVPGMIYLSVDPHGRYHKAYVQAWWENWIACARFLGALKAEP